MSSPPLTPAHRPPTRLPSPTARRVQNGTAVSRMLVNLTSATYTDSWFMSGAQASPLVALAAGQSMLLEGQHCNGQANGLMQVPSKGLHTRTGERRAAVGCLRCTTQLAAL